MKQYEVASKNVEMKIESNNKLELIFPQKTNQ